MNHRFDQVLETIGAWMLGLLWLLPLLYAVWTAFHPAAYATRFDLFAPLTLDNFVAAWQAAPFSRFLLNTVMMVTLILVVQFVLCTFAAFAFARLIFPGRDLLLDDAARMEGCGLLARLWRVYVPLAKPTYIAYGLVLVSYHWNNFLWPLIITNSVTTRPLTVGLSVFATTDQGIDWSIVTAATLVTSAPLLVAFLLFQRQFVQSFMRAGIR